MIRFLEHSRSFYLGRYYPILVVLLVFLGHSLGMELIFGGIMLGTLVFGLLINHDVRFTMMPMLCTLFTVSVGNFTPSNPGYERFYGHMPTLITILIMAAVVIAAILFFVIRNRKIANPIRLRGVLLSLLILCGALLINGLFSANYTVANLIFTILLALSMPLVYVIFAAFLRFDRSVTDYFMRCLVIVGMLICAELVHAYFTTVQFVDGSIVKESVVLGWGVWTNIGSMLVFLMPACFYFAASHKHGWIGYVLGLVMFLCTVLSQSRAALLIGALSLVLCLGYLCIKGRNRRINRILTLTLFLCAAAVCVLFWSKILSLVQNFINYGFGDNGRFDLWSAAWDAFLRAPVFGSGFYDTCSYAGWEMFGTPQMCHNTVLQLLGSAGVVGLGAYAYHRYVTVKLLFKKPNPVKVFLGICILGFLLFSLLDVVFFIAYPNMFYTLMLLFMQFSEYQDDERYI